ncbi:MAG: hypothetical protein ACOVS5_08885 [Oligoflexus sp.]|jgi:hypothetical protein
MLVKGRRRLWLVSFLSSFFIGLTLIIYLFYSLESNSRQRTHLPAELEEKFGAATGEYWIDGAFFRFSIVDGIGVAAYHSLKAICPAFDDFNECKKLFKSKLHINRTFVSWVYGPGIIRCARLLDVCFFRVEGSNENFTPETGEEKRQQSVYLKLLTQDRTSSDDYIIGNLVSKRRVFTLFKIPSRPGYSGSPLLNEEGKPLAIAVTGGSISLNVLTLLGFLDKDSSYKFFRSYTSGVSFHIVSKLAACYREGDEACWQQTIQTAWNYLQDDFRDLKDSPSATGDFLLEYRNLKEFIRRGCEDYRDHNPLIVQDLALMEPEVVLNQCAIALRK